VFRCCVARDSVSACPEGVSRLGEDSRTPPLSRRVPGATNRPKPQLRTAPPVLPDDLIERLRAQAKARSEAPAERVKPDPPEQTAPLPPMPQRVRKADESRHRAPARGGAVPDSSGSHGLDPRETTEPIPVISGPAEGAAAPPSRDVTSADQVRPAIAPRPKEARVGVRATVALPARRPASPGSVPARVPDGASAPKGPPKDVRARRPAGSALSPEADSDDITAPIPVVSAAAERPTEKPARGDPTSRPAPPAQPATAAQRATRRWRLSAQPVQAEVPQPGPAESELTPMPAAPEPGQTMLRPLFVEADPVEEAVATVRAQAAGRESRRLWKRIRDNR